MLHPSHHATLAVVFTSAAAHFIFCVTHSKPLFWVYLCYLHLSRILVGNYLHPLKFLMRKISVYLHHPHHPSCSVWSVSRESLCHYTFKPHWICFPGSQFCVGGGDFQCSKVSEVGILEVAWGFILRGGSVVKLLKVFRSRAREGWIWRGVLLATLITQGGVLEIWRFGASTFQWEHVLV